MGLGTTSQDDEDILSLLGDDPAARPMSEIGGGWQHVPTYDPPPVDTAEVRAMLESAPSANPVQDAGREWQHNADPFQSTQSDSETGVEIADREPLALPEMRITARRDATPPSGNDDADLDEGNWLIDTLNAAAPLVAPSLVEHPIDQFTESASRLARRGARATSAVASDPTAALLGLTDQSTMHLGDEMADIAHSPAGLGLGLVMPGLLGMRAGPTGDEMRAASTEAQQRSPQAYGVGEDAGFLAPMLIPGGAESSLARTAAEGFGFSAADALGRSDAPIEERLPDAALAGLEGATVGAAAHGLGRLGSGAMRRLERFGQGHAEDLVRAASGGSPVGAAAMQRWEESPGGIPGSAERVQQLGIVPSLGTADDVTRQAEEALSRVGEGGELGQLTRELQESGATIPTGQSTAIGPLPETPRTLMDVYDQVARRLEEVPSHQPLAAPIRSLQERVAGTFGDAAQPEALRRELAALQEGGRIFRDPRVGDVAVPDQAARDLHAGLSGVRDQVAESALGAGTADRYRRLRQQVQTAMLSRDLSRASELREAGRRILSPTDYAAGGLGSLLALGGAAHGGPSGLAAAAGGLALGAANHYARQREATIAASLSGLARRISEGQIPPTLARWGDILRRAVSRGTLPVVHAMLARTDPEYATAVAEEEAADRAASTDEAAGLLSAPEADPFADLGGVPDEDPFAELGGIPDEETP